MGTSAQRNLLKNICANSPWTYAVFWKLKHENNIMLLTWEDGYCDYTKSRQSLRARSDHGNSSKETQSISCDQQSNRNPMELSLGFAIGYLSALQYPLGEGVIGKIALAGNESWIYPDNNRCGTSRSSMLKFPDEWLQQVTAGIKTILLVTVLPYGVLQLGSIEKVTENHLRVTEIRERFNSLHQEKEPISSALSDSIVCSPGAKMTLVLNGRGTSSDWTLHNRSEFENFNVKTTHEELFSSDNLPFTVPDVTPDYLKGPSDVTTLPCEHYMLDPCLELLEESNTEYPFASNDLHEALIGDLLSIGCVKEVSGCSFLSDDANVEHSVLGELVDPYIYGDTPGVPDTEKDEAYTDLIINESSFHFPVAIGASAIHICNGEVPWDSYELGEYGHFTHSYLERDMDFTSIYYPSSINAVGWVDVDDINHPQAVLSGALEDLDDFQFYDCYSIKPTGSSSLSSPDSELKAVWSLEDTAPPQPESASLCKTVDISRDSTDSDPAVGSGLTTSVEENKPKKRSCGNSGKGDNKQPSNKKRKVIENAGHNKPRPRDRQLIQDRLKELRELIQNGSTCSIDGLLDKAIKLMMFLSSVTEQAEKLSQTVNEEVASKNNLADIQNHLKGANWAVEMNKDLKLSPIVMKDLKRPGYMLIEMCNEHDLFFEITKVICHLRLTILRGIMETHSDDTWAQFIIEAPKGISRLEIFVPLMQLLQLHKKRVHGTT